MKNFLKAVLVAAAALGLVPDAQAQNYPLTPVWQKLPVTWISSKPADGSAGGYNFSSTAPVYHNSTTPGWASTLFDTSLAIDISSSFYRQQLVSRSVTYDTSDVFPFLRFKVNFNPAAGIDTMAVFIEMSVDGETWSVIDSTNFMPLRVAATSTNGLTAAVDSITSVYADRAGVGQWDFDQISPRLAYPSSTTINYTRTLGNQMKWLRIRVRRDKTFACDRCTSISYAGKAYTVDAYLWSRPPYTSNQSTMAQ